MGLEDRGTREWEGRLGRERKISERNLNRKRRNKRVVVERDRGEEREGGGREVEREGGRLDVSNEYREGEMR